MANNAVLTPKEIEVEAAQTARDQVSGVMWDLNLMMVFYAVFAATLILALMGVTVQIVAAVAFIGLVAIWIMARLRYRRMYRTFLHNEIQHLRAPSQEVSNESPSKADAVPSAAVAEATEPCPITLRQKEILTLMACGNSNKQIAVKLNLSEQTIKNRLRNMYLKLGVNDRTQAVLMAMNHGWITPTFPQTSPRDTAENLKK